ncbi:DUF6221 family protein [Streptomyces venezuelae]|uniref:Uncharacterized protein n=1 Tax=Streptomyces venezuelae TaxID=54571 RepID=A0A5P2B5R5_STRVZ|nr:DUF6221 family protein [Streptomyces venezuelae]QES25784.1 hypothetical protein DEJ47_04360 [Streptomyces venezuelae]
MDDLVLWLGEQLDEDEADARAAATRSPEWRLARPLDDEELGDAGLLRPAELKHAERHDPARVLREIDAKRRIIEQCAYWNERAAREAADPPKYPQPGLDLGLLLDAMNPILRALALPYADRPGYREDWRP